MKRKGKGSKEVTMGVDHKRINYPLLPNSFKVKLQYAEQFLTPSSTAGSTTSFGLNYWASRIPGYGAQIYDLYKYAQVLRVDYVFRVSSTVLAPFQVVVTPAPYAATATFDVLRAYRGRKLQESSGVNSANKAQIRATFHPSQVEGVPTMFDKTTWYTQPNQSGASPLDINSHAVWFGVGPLDSSTVGSYTVQVEIQYHMHFFSPINTVLSLIQEEENHFHDYEEPSPAPSHRLHPITHNTTTGKLLKRI